MAEKKTSASSISAPPPTEKAIAVAVKQGQGRDQTPSVIAGGRGRVAEQILEVAFAHGIKVREDADLAQMLSAVDLDSDIPLEAFATVAEILTYMYEANNVGHPDHENGNQMESERPPRPSADELVAMWSVNERDINDGSS